MQLTDTIQTVALVVAFIGIIPGTVAFIRSRDAERPRAEFTIKRPFYDNTPPGRLFLIVTVKPGRKGIVISSLQPVTPCLSIGPSDKPPALLSISNPEQLPELNTFAECSTGPLEVFWHVPRSSDFAGTLSSKLLISAPNRDALSALVLEMKWNVSACSLSRFITIHHRTKVTITLKSPIKTGQNPHSEVML